MRKQFTHTVKLGRGRRRRRRRRNGRRRKKKRRRRSNSRRRRRRKRRRRRGRRRRKKRRRKSRRRRGRRTSSRRRGSRRRKKKEEEEEGGGGGGGGGGVGGGGGEEEEEEGVRSAKERSISAVNEACRQRIQVIQTSKRSSGRIASLALWLRRPPRERQSRVQFPLSCLGLCPGRVIPVTSKLMVQWLPSQAHVDIGSALRLVGPVSEHGDWVR